MRLPWRGIVVDGIRLDRKQQRGLLEEARHLARDNATLRERFRWITMTAIVYVLCMCIWTPLLFVAITVINTSKARSNEMLFGAINGGFAGGMLFIIAGYFWRRSHIRLIRQAMRRLGYELCSACGYWLKGLDDSADRCPECGTTREAIPVVPEDEP